MTTVPDIVAKISKEKTQIGRMRPEPSQVLEQQDVGRQPCDFQIKNPMNFNRLSLMVVPRHRSLNERSFFRHIWTLFRHEPLGRE
jgi:hypothetical protein